MNSAPGTGAPPPPPSAGAAASTPWRQTVSGSGSEILRLLRAGQIELEGRLADASNATLRGWITLDGVTLRCVYKPVRGERPLWDFPDGTLAGREVAAYLVSQATGWDLVPPTVLRDGPFGPGSCQLWIDEPVDAVSPVGFIPAESVPPGWFPILAARDDAGTAYVLAHADDPRLARLALLDVVLNNADRKAGHILSGPGNRILGIDHGICFHVEGKLRTVLWGWQGQPLPAEATEMLHRLAGALTGPLGAALATHLTPAEVAALAARVDRLCETNRFPVPAGDRPAVPWPPV